MRTKGPTLSLMTCPCCGLKKSEINMFSGHTIRPELKPYINQKYPSWVDAEYICSTCLNEARSKLVEEYLMNVKGVLSPEEIEVIGAIRNHDLISEHPDEAEQILSFGEKISDRLAEIGGSWMFIISFGILLIFWIIFNTIMLTNKFDPYPYILLNLVLSCLAALQAPVIMMSQNRKETKDRHRAEADYKTNLMAELEIRHLHLKLDDLTNNQWHKLLEIQQIQLDVMSEYMNAQKSRF